MLKFINWGDEAEKALVQSSQKSLQSQKNT